MSDIPLSMKLSCKSLFSSIQIQSCILISTTLQLVCFYTFQSYLPHVEGTRRGERGGNQEMGKDSVSSFFLFSVFFLFNSVLTAEHLHRNLIGCRHVRRFHLEDMLFISISV